MNRRTAVAAGVVIAAIALSGISFLFPDAGQGDAASRVAVAAAAETETAVNSEPGGAVLFEGPLKQSASSADTKLMTVAENASLQLVLEQPAGLVRIVNKSSGITWLSYPQDVSDIPSQQRGVVRNPVVIRYTQGSGSTPTYPQKEEGTLTAVQIKDGVRIMYGLSALGLEIALDYRLTDNGLDVKVPFDLLKEDGKSKIVSLELLPYFEAARPDEDGYLFIPDGSGAIIRFKQKHLTYFDRYNEFIYGGDAAFRNRIYEQNAKFAGADVMPNSKERIALPVYGLVRGKTGFAAIVTEGEHDAKIAAAPSGYQNVELYRVAVEFIYRNDDTIFIGDSGAIPVIQANIIPGDRSVKYVLLEGGKADYVGMAHAYRDYLLRDRGVQPVADVQPLQLRVVGGAVRKEMIGTSYIPMTTFEQARMMIDALLAKGISEIELTYEGWSAGGVYGRQPDHFPVAGKLGGFSGLESLIRYAKSQGVRVYLDANYVKPFAKYSKFRASAYAVRSMNREVLQLYDPHPATYQPLYRNEYYLVKPDKALDKFMAGEAGQFAELRADGLRLDYMGDLLYSDQDLKMPISRRGTIKRWVQAMDASRSNLGHTAVEYGYSYALGHVDRLDDVPIDSSHFFYEDAAVPFFQIALHGIVPLNGEPVNLLDNPREQLLRMMEYGVMPSYELTHARSSDLKRTEMEWLFSSEFAGWLDPMTEQYRAAAEAMREVAGRAIADYRQVGERTFATTYDNGVSILVNYGDEAVQAEGVAIGPQSYFVKKGGDSR